MDKDKPQSQGHAKPQHPSIKFFRLIPGPSYDSFGKLMPSSAKLWLVLFDHARQHGQLVADPEEGMAVLLAKWTLAEAARAARMSDETVSKCLTNLDKCGFISVTLNKNVLSYSLLPPPKPQVRSEPSASGPSAQPAKINATKAAAKNAAAPGERGRRGEGEDLATYIIKLLPHSKEALKLVDVVKKVIDMGYKTQSDNLSQAVYNCLSKLRQQGFVAKDAEKKYFLLAMPDVDNPPPAVINRDH